MIERRGKKRGERIKEPEHLITEYKEGMTVSMSQAIVYRITKLCEEKEMSIYRLAKDSGINQSALNEIMQGRSKDPRIKTIGKIAKGFNMNLSSFFNDSIFKHIDYDID